MCNKVHFKRQGFGGLLKLKGELKEFYIEYDYDFGYLKIVRYYNVPKEYKGKTYLESHSKTILYKNYNKTESTIENFKDIEREINNITGLNISIENFIESYFIGSRQGDKDILNNIDITNYTVTEVLNQCNINLKEFFKAWRVKEQIENILDNPTHKILNMKFSDLYSLIHWNCHKQDFENIFLAAI